MESVLCAKYPSQCLPASNPQCKQCTGISSAVCLWDVMLLLYSNEVTQWKAEQMHCAGFGEEAKWGA